MIIHLSDYRKPDQPMSKRTFEASLKNITKLIEKGQVTSDQAYQKIQRLIDEYFFPEGR
ncbi:hypothetical protein [Brevibacillus massiliensis]|uniref:hypothetical protein n=1 Tax=Brevibacillus massiliensis TaxID=1118054 RepID=UPI0002FB8739|nr:hypothetical protein [Brevibacillus massiliensis]